MTISRRDALIALGAASMARIAPAAAAGDAEPGWAHVPQMSFADREIASAASGAGRPAPSVSYALDTTLGPQAYRFDTASENSITISAGDAIGAMYAGLDVAERLRFGAGAVSLLADGRVHAPYVARRGIKFNIPLDLRTPSYSDGSTSARANIPEVWSRDFWSDYFDEMARHRYNVLSLWSEHPFPSMVKVPEFPDVALADVWRSLEPLGPEPFVIRGTDAVPARYLANHEVVKTITIDEKIAFWRDVMRMADDRGIQVYVFTWNIFVYGTDGKYGITDKIDNPVTVAYLRASVRELVTTYPLLAGIGITAGENLPSDHPGISAEQWLWTTYGEGVRDALKGDAGRRVHLIHRFHETKEDEMERNWRNYPGYPETFTYSYKYSVAHMYSSTKPPFIAEVEPYLKGKMKTWLTVRNDDIYSFRWGDPGYARAYVMNLPGRDKLAGFYMGPDGYCWGRDFLDRDQATQDFGSRRPLVMQTQWYAFLMWSRLAFDPTIPDSYFQSLLAARFPHADAGELFAASCAASKIIPQVNRLFWRDTDFRFLPEACAYSYEYTTRGTRFYTVRDFMNGVSMPGTGILSIREWRYQLGQQATPQAITPLDCADELDKAADTVMDLLAALRRSEQPSGRSEWSRTLGDYEAMAELGRYYALKVRGACALALFDEGRKPDQRAEALAHLGDALKAWQRYAAVRDRQYLPGFYNRIGYVDITALASSAAEDIDVAAIWQPGTLRFDPAAPVRYVSSIPGIR